MVLPENFFTEQLIVILIITWVLISVVLGMVLGTLIDKSGR